jgi:hypothetical protein
MYTVVFVAQFWSQCYVAKYGKYTHVATGITGYRGAAATNI